MKARGWNLWWIAAALTFAALLWARLQAVGGAGVTRVAERGAARELELPVLDGGTWRMSDYRGKVVVVNLWATWCGPCRAETPELVRMAREDRGLAVVGVSVDTGADREAKVRGFVRQFGVEYPVALAGETLALTGAVDSIPRTMVFDREGRLAKVWVGEFRAAAMRKDVRLLEGER